MSSTSLCVSSISIMKLLQIIVVFCPSIRFKKFHTIEDEVLGKDEEEMRRACGGFQEIARSAGSVEC